jgi:acyl-CoA synthetase (AMP-forming)/AMP-acid ligase II
VAIFDDQMTALAPRQIGEICVQGDNITSGYRNNPKANEEAFSGGWFHTGDQGYLDDEGYLFITGRIKELINRGGEKISPSKIDEALLAHPAVAEAISFGVPDLKYGEEVNAAIVLKPGATATSEELTEFCLKRLAAFQVPKRYFFANSLPKTGSGKIQRKQVSEQFIAREPTAS